MTRSPLRRLTALALAITLGAGMAFAAPPASPAIATDVGCMSVNCGGGGGGYSSNATLASLTMSAGILTPAFSPGTSSYTASVANAVSSVSLTPTVADSTATVQINGNIVGSGIPSLPITLATGANTITITVIAQDTTTRTSHTITVTRASLSSNADLTGISLSAGTLSPAFASGTTSYTASVAFATHMITVGATLADPSGTVTINGLPATSVPIPLYPGGNIVTIVAMAPDGTTTKTTTITAFRAPPSDDSSLSALTVSGGTLSPVFAPGTMSYTVSVPSTTHSLSFLPVSADALATVSTAETTITRGESFAASLQVGPNVFRFVVSAENGTTSTYTVTVTRASPTDAALSGINLSDGTLSPAFSAATTTYAAAVGYLTREITVGATTADSAASTTVNGLEASARTIPLSLGKNTISIVTTAQDGVTTLTTTIVVTRAAPNLNLSSLSVTGGTLMPAFNPGTTGYTLALPYTVSSVDVAASATESEWTLEIEGIETSAATVAVGVGVSTITVTVIATLGESRSYTIEVNRAAPSGNSALSGLGFSNHALSPAFAPDTTSYALAVGNSTSSAIITPMSADAAATVSINGAQVTRGDSVTVTLPVGATTFTTIVTAENGTTTTYTVRVTRAAPDATLSALTLSVGTLSPTFNPATADYTATVGNLVEEITVGATPADPAATVTISGASQSGSTFPLSVGTNTITIVTTSHDGTITRTTTVVVTREAVGAPAVAFELDFEAGDEAAGAPLTGLGRNLFPGSTATVTMHSTPVVIATGTVLANGTIVLNARIPAGAVPGAHRLVFDGIAADGSAVTRTAWFTVLSDGTIGGVSLTRPVPYAQPAAVRALPFTGADLFAPAFVGAAAAFMGTLLLLLGALLRRRIAF